jgi:hypothetical protein
VGWCVCFVAQESQVSVKDAEKNVMDVQSKSVHKLEKLMVAGSVLNSLVMRGCSKTSEIEHSFNVLKKKDYIG